ncbi:hypothetical protein PMAYCL1PPCAC_22926 [Pristionchus mayeri]|uniref:UDP-glucuronosyltransferase n=1 Tax=Pristionchus mayeri TaxID=1317129 RepID=A0AAN5CX64_9BILA|nr:hypothetical protein PMAYCL1PPCAC_22926 [Pristionchus mayeri]
MQFGFSLLYLLLLDLTSGCKFLAYSPQFAISHVNFIAKISDTLVEAGHEVVIVAPRIHPDIRRALAKKARVIELPENEHSRAWHEGEKMAMDLAWNNTMLELMVKGAWSGGFSVVSHMLKAANATVHHPGLIEQLRTEQFDAAFSENLVGFGIFHLAGISRTALAVSFANFESCYHLTQMPSDPSYVPSIFSSSGARMSFRERVSNTLSSFAFGLMFGYGAHLFQPIFDELTPGEKLQDMVADNSLVLLNSEPLLDFPRPSVHRVIEIGGIAVAMEAEPLTEYWSEVLNRRKRTVILSFGTYVRASRMPEIYKATIRNVMSKFDDVTFIWKYEVPEHNVSQGIENIVETTWLPQISLLNDDRLTAFITHGGQGSTLEAAYAGKPMLMMPTQGDQHRNSAMIKRAGFGELIQLSDLGEEDQLERAVRDILENQEYANNAKRVASMLKNKPFSAKQKLVRNMEFLACYGPLRMLDHEGRNLNFIQYFLIDVFLFLSGATAAVISLIGICCIASCRWCSRKLSRKYDELKQD